MKARIIGDHSKYHCGCKAVWDTLNMAVSANGIRVTTGSDHDALIVNGEGSMHHGRPTFWSKMRALSEAADEGKIACLVNSVWQDNPNEFDSVLGRLAVVSVRDVLSRQELANRHGVASTMCLDFSYFAPVDGDSEITNFAGVETETDYFSVASNEFRLLPRSPSQRPLIDLKDYTWGKLVRSLKTTSLLVTGRHHAVYAACKARTSFAALEGNSHKIRGLIATSGVDIPVAEKLADLPDVIAWVRTHRSHFDRLFDWMEHFAAQSTPAKVLAPVRRAGAQ